MSGPNVEGLAANEYASIVEVNVPSEARETRFEGGLYSTLVGEDGPTQVHARYVRVKQGEQATLTLGFVLPAPIDRMTIEPSGRVKPLRWNFDGRAFKIEKRRTVEFGDSP